MRLTFFVLGIFLGSYIAAKGSQNLDGDYRLKTIPVIVRWVAYLWGLVLQLQVVAIGNGLVETATMSYEDGLL